MLIVARAGARVDGRGGDDRICGGAGRDRIVGGPGADRLSGAGRDVLTGGRGVDSFRYRARGVRVDVEAGELVNGRRRELAATLRRGSVELAPRQVVSVEQQGEHTQTVLRRGARPPQRGDVLVVAVSPSAPRGVLGTVVSTRRLASGEIAVVTRPASLDEAYSRFEVAYTGTLADFAERPETGASARAAAVGVQRVAFTCTRAGSVTRSVELDPRTIQITANLDADPQFPYFELEVLGRPQLTLLLEAEGSVGCTAQVKRQCRAWGPLVVCFTPILKLDADGRITLRYDWKPDFFFHVVRAGYTPSRNRDERSFESSGDLSLDGEANVHARLHLGATVSVAEAIGLAGVLAPHVDGHATFSTPPPLGCAKVTAAVDYQLSAFASVFVKRWTWDLAKGDFLHRVLFDRCTAQGGGGAGDPREPAGGGGPPGGGPPGGGTPTPPGGGEPAPPNQVSVDQFGRSGDGSSSGARIGRDGRWVWFASEANLVAEPMTQDHSVYVRDMEAGVTHRLDPPAPVSTDQFEVNAISPNGRWAVIGRQGGSRFRADAVTGAVIQLPLGNQDVGITDDGETIVLGFELRELARWDQPTTLPCPIGSSQPGGESLEVRIDNPRYATVVSDRCSNQYAGYVVDLATRTAVNVMPPACYWNLGNACVRQLAVSDDGAHFASVRIVPGTDDAAFYGSTHAIPDVGVDPQVCGLTADGSHAILAGRGLWAYEAASGTTQPIAQHGPGDPGAAFCWPQSVTADGEVVYQRSSALGAPDSQVFVERLPES